MEGQVFRAPSGRVEVRTAADGDAVLWWPPRLLLLKPRSIVREALSLLPIPDTPEVVHWWPLRSPPQLDEIGIGRGVEDVLGWGPVRFDEHMAGGLERVGERCASALSGQVLMGGILAGPPPQLDDVAIDVH